MPGSAAVEAANVSLLGMLVLSVRDGRYGVVASNLVSSVSLAAHIKGAVITNTANGLFLRKGEPICGICDFRVAVKHV